MIDLDEWADTHGEIRMTHSQFEREEMMFSEGQNFECEVCGELFYEDELINKLCPECWVDIYDDE